VITQDRNAAAAPPNPPPPPAANDFPWWRMWPSPAGRPQPLNRRSLTLGGLLAGSGLLVVDGLLGLMAWYASGRLAVGLAVGLGLLVLTGLEFAIVAWAAKRRQDLEARRAEP